MLQRRKKTLQSATGEAENSVAITVKALKVGQSYEEKPLLYIYWGYSVHLIQIS